MSIETYINNNLRKIRNYCVKICGDISNGELLLSTVLEKIWLNKNSFKGNETDFVKWSFTIAKSQYLNDIKYNSRLKRSAPIIDINNKDLEYLLPNYLLQGTEDKLLIEDILDKIKKNFKKYYIKVFEMYFIEGFSQKEISKECNVSETNVSLIIKKMKTFIINNFNLYQPIY